jgi:hypothetical protein
MIPATIAFVIWGVALAAADVRRAAARATGSQYWTTAGIWVGSSRGRTSPGKDLAAGLARRGSRGGAAPPAGERDAGIGAVVAPSARGFRGGVALLMFVLPFKFTYANYINSGPPSSSGS